MSKKTIVAVSVVILQGIVVILQEVILKTK